MSDYDKLVKALRSASTVSTAFGKLMADAADAIEELKDMPWVESVQVDKLRQRIDELEEVACHCNVRENAELIAKILDDDVDGKAFELPKRGKWVWKHRHHGGFKTAKGKCECGRDVYAQIDERYETDDPYCPFCGVMNDSIHLNYCPNCGAKMEAQE